MDPAWQIAIIVLVACTVSFLKRGAYPIAILAGLGLFSIGLSVPDNVRIITASIALALVLFDNSRMRFAHLDTTAHKTLTIAACSVGFHAIVLGAAFRVLGFDWLTAIIGAIALSCVHQFANEWLSHESRFTSILSVILVFLLVSIKPVDSFAGVVGLVAPWLVGIGTGVFVAILALRVVKHGNMHQRYVAFAVAAVLAYLFAAALDGVGVLAVITLGLFLGNTVASERERLDVHPFKAILVLACVLLGLMAWPSISVVIAAAVLLALSIIIRFLCWLRVPFQERVKLALMGSRGADAVAMLVLLGIHPALAPLIPFAALFVLFSRMTWLETF